MCHSNDFNTKHMRQRYKEHFDPLIRHQPWFHQNYFCLCWPTPSYRYLCWQARNENVFQFVDSSNWSVPKSHIGTAHTDNRRGWNPKYKLCWSHNACSNTADPLPRFSDSLQCKKIPWWTQITISLNLRNAHQPGDTPNVQPSTEENHIHSMLRVHKNMLWTG